MQVSFPNRLGEVLAGDLHIVDEKRCVVLCHGFCAHRHLGVIAHLYEGLVDAGVSVFRFDFSGNGQSQGDWQESTYLKQPKDLKDALNYLRREHGFEEFVLVGHSMAGGVVLFVAGSDEQVVGVVSLAGVLYPGKVRERMPERFTEGYEFHVPQVEGVPMPGRSYVLTQQYLDDAQKLDVINHLPSCPILALHGRHDDRIPINYSEDLVARTDGRLVLLDTDHFFADISISEHILRFFEGLRNR